MTAKAYDLLKELKPRIVEYGQNSTNPDDPNAKVTITFACSKEHKEDLGKFVTACAEGPDEDIVLITGTNVSSIVFKVVSDYDFRDKVIEDIL